MLKNRLYAIALAVWVLFYSGCGTSPANSTPEETFISYSKSLIEGDVDALMKLDSVQSMKEQGIDEQTVRAQTEETVKQIKFNNTKYIDSMVQNVYKIDENTVAVEGQLKYSSDMQKEPQTQGTVMILKKEDGGWKTSENEYVKSYKITKKCGEKGGIKICVDSIMQFSKIFSLKGSIENANSNEYAFGFAGPAKTALAFNEENYVGDHPRLRDSMDAKNIPSGKSEVTFIVGDDVFGGIIAATGSPKTFRIDGIVSMNGSLPSGFENGLSISIPLN